VLYKGIKALTEILWKPTSVSNQIVGHFQKLIPRKINTIIKIFKETTSLLKE